MCPIILVGSGISLTAGMPGVDVLTNKILDVSNLEKKILIELTYYQPTDEKLKKSQIFKFLNYLRDIILEHKDRGRLATESFSNFCNYEEIFNMISFMKEDLEYNFEHPFLYSIYEQIKQKKYFKTDIEFNTDNDQGISGLSQLSSLIKLTVRYFYLILNSEFNVPFKDLSYLNFFSEYYRINESYEIFTLNNDLVLEEYFTHRRINFFNGFFYDDTIKSKIFCPKELYKDYLGIKLVKLHGSINWVRGRNRFNNSDCLCYSNDYSFDYIEVQDEKNFLIGTNSKMLEYSGRFYYIDLYNKFYNSLRNNNNLIVSGYGFADRGINITILNWFYSDLKNNKIVIIDPNPSTLTSKGSIDNIIRNYKANVTIIPKSISDVTYDEVMSGF